MHREADSDHGLKAIGVGPYSTFPNVHVALATTVLSNNVNIKICV